MRGQRHTGKRDGTTLAGFGGADAPQLKTSGPAVPVNTGWKPEPTLEVT
jgi:hypothetical protein